ncbi:hypothetical protein CQW23_16383 [Capsicum baccatum]|uniref:Uncharacterized protein n=1 Tax=Capsicum baccatum TaxID=33114 RepID=A0A2G2WAS3_CAPBA|nr:hypothetical protein CQW23_16383 [Capsicum baccatum]
MAISLPWQPLKPYNKTQKFFHYCPSQSRKITYTQAFRRSDFDVFARRVKSGEVWKDAWKNANDGFEQFVYEARKSAERIDRRYEVRRRVIEVVESAGDRSREIDREFEITKKWRNFELDFRSNLPRYRKQLNDVMDTPLGRSAATIFFLWFALSGWLFRILIIATWVLPFAGPLLIGVVANNLVIKGQCPACRRQFIGNKNSTVRCANCGNIVWQPKDDFFSRGSRGTASSKSEPDIIDVEFEEK